MSMLNFNAELENILVKRLTDEEYAKLFLEMLNNGKKFGYKTDADPPIRKTNTLLNFLIRKVKASPARAQLISEIIESLQDLYIRNNITPGQVIIRLCQEFPEIAALKFNYIIAALKKGHNDTFIRIVDMVGFPNQAAATAALRFAVELQNYNIATFILSKGVVPDRATLDKLITYAMNNNTLPILEFVFDNFNIDPNEIYGVAEANGRTDRLLHAAVERNLHDIVRFLINKGADVALINKNGQSALELAANDKMTDILLKQKSILHKNYKKYRANKLRTFVPPPEEENNENLEKYLAPNYYEKNLAKRQNPGKEMISYLKSRLPGPAKSRRAHLLHMLNGGKRRTRRK